MNKAMEKKFDGCGLDDIPYKDVWVKNFNVYQVVCVKPKPKECKNCHKDCFFCDKFCRSTTHFDNRCTNKDLCKFKKRKLVQVKNVRKTLWITGYNQWDFELYDKDGNEVGHYWIEDGGNLKNTKNRIRKYHYEKV